MLIGSVRKLVVLRLLIAMSVAPALPTGAAAENQPKKSSALSSDRLVSMKGLSFLIPDGVGFEFSTNSVSHEPLLALDVSLDRLNIQLQEVQGRTIDRIILGLRTEGRPGQRLGYERFLNSPPQQSIAGYHVYKMDIAWSLYVSSDGSIPSYFTCHNENVGVMAGSPRMCDISETIHIRVGDVDTVFALYYLVNFPDVPMLSGIDRNIRLFLTSLVQA